MFHWTDYHLSDTGVTLAALWFSTIVTRCQIRIQFWEIKLTVSLWEYLYNNSENPLSHEWINTKPLFYQGLEQESLKWRVGFSTARNNSVFLSIFCLRVNASVFKKKREWGGVGGGREVVWGSFLFRRLRLLLVGLHEVSFKTGGACGALPYPPSPRVQQKQTQHELWLLTPPPNVIRKSREAFYSPSPCCCLIVEIPIKTAQMLLCFGTK